MHSISSHLKVSVRSTQTLKDSHVNVFAGKFSPDGNLLAVSHSDGMLRVHTLNKVSGTKYEVHVPPLERNPFSEDAKEDESPHENVYEIEADHSITGIAWKPMNDPGFAQTQELKAVTADGRVLSWTNERPKELKVWH